ncbi:MULTISPECIES: hypothetical protein [unclassified Xanthomonas]|uniref:hypothetical protein n=1 Tax=unclassified Xanthomonas TaxID=2643310 RepID=UPI002FC66561
MRRSSSKAVSTGCTRRLPGRMRGIACGLPGTACAAVFDGAAAGEDRQAMRLRIDSDTDWKNTHQLVSANSSERCGRTTPYAGLMFDLHDRYSL